ncbi:hypothetical protein ACIGHN_13355 [Acidovorax sp. NPDC077693]|uniref:hypothetical protein n=1 Tax=unclassified Acidovorax TaxID=2684926 RepID=UPI0037C7FE20
MNIATLTIEMAANVARLRQDMENAASVVQSATAKMQKAAELAGKALGLIGVGLSLSAFTGFVRNAIDAADALDEMSGRVGVSAKELSGLQLAYKQAGMGNEAMASSLAKLSREMSEGNVGLRALGVNTRNVDGSLRGTTAVLLDVADKFKGMEDGAAKTALAMEIFGKSGAEMVPLLNSGAEGIAEMTAMAEKLGLVIEDSTAAQAGQFNDTLELLGLGVQGVGTRIAAQLLPTLTNLTASFLESMTSGDRLKGVADFLAASLKILYTVGVGIVEVFSTVGKTLGAAMGQVIAILRGDFAQASAIGREWQQDVTAGWSATSAAVQAAWSAESNAAVVSAATTMKVSKDLLADQKAREEAAKKAKAAADKAAEEAKKKAAEGAKLVAGLLAQDKGYSSDYDEKMSKMAAAFAAGAVNAGDLAKAQEFLLSQQPLMKKAFDEATKASQAAADARHKEADGIDAFMRAQEEAAAASLKSVKDRIASLQDEERAAELSRKLNVSLAEAIEMVAIARLQEKQAGFYENSEGWERLQREISARQELLALMSTKALREREASGWTDLWSSVDRTAHDVWTNIWEGGSNVFKKLGQTIKATVLDLLYQLTVRPFIIQLGTSIFGSGFGAAAQAAGGGGFNVMGNIGNVVSAGMNLLTDGVSASIGTAFGKFANSEMGAKLGLSYYDGNAFAPTNLGSTVGTGLGMLGNGMMGYGLSSMISGGYSVGGGNTVNVLSGIASAFFGPLAGVVGGLINRLFGRKLADMGIEGEFGGATGFDGRSYEFYKGGLLRSDKTKYSDLDPELEKALGDSFKGMRAQVAFFADTLGLSVDKLEEHVTSFKFSTQGLNAEQIQAKFQEAMATANNELAEQVLGTWESTSEKVRRTITRTEGHGMDMVQYWEEVEETITQTTYKASEYAKEGEKAIDTLTRLATSLTTVNSIFDTLGYTLLDASLKGADAASKIAEAFGGLDKMTAATSSYFLNYYSEDERRAVAYRQLDKQLDEIGIADVPKTREAYRRLAESQDLTTEAGRKAYAVLIQLSGVFAELTGAAEDTTAALEAQARELVQTIYGLFRRALQRDREALNEEASKVRDIISGIADVVSMLRGNARELALSVESTAQMMAVQGMLYVEQALDGVRAGASVTDYAGLTDAISAARGGIDKGVYVSQFERDRDALVLAGQLADLGDLGDMQLTVEERQLKGITDQLEYLDSLDRRADALVNGTVELTGTVSSYFEQLLALIAADKKPTAVAPAGAGGGSSGGAVFGPGSAAQQVDAKYRKVVSLATAGVAYQPVIDPETINRLDGLAGLYHSYDGSNDLRGLLTAVKAAGGTLEDLHLLSGYFEGDWRKAAESVGMQPFAKGGAFTNGIVSKPTFFNIGQMGEGGQSEGILPLANVGGRLGVYSMAGGSGEVVAELQALRGQFGWVQERLAAIDANTEGLPQMVEHTDQVTEGGIGTRTEIVNIAPLASAIAKELAKELA